MRAGLEVGEKIEISITVDDRMRASLLGQAVHPLYGTAAMIEHMEWAARQHILPYLEPGEEGVGHHVDIKHLAPAPIGATIRICSTVSDIQPRRVGSHVEAWWNETLIGEGTLVQAIAPTEKLYACVQPKAPPVKASAPQHTPTDAEEEPFIPPPALLASRNGQAQLRIEVIKWESGMFACTRYDEWLICRIQLKISAAQAAEVDYEGAFLLRYELEEWLEAVQAIAQNQRIGFLSDFLEPVFKIEMSAGEVGEWACTFQLTPPEQDARKVSLLVEPAALQQFGTELAAQLEGFPSRL
jgi:fluoroacetyl-CoA thioesterase